MTSETQFNTLERAVLDWCIDYYKEATLTEQIKNASFERREWTKVGFYINFSVPKELKPIDFNNFPNKDFSHKGFPISGPYIESDGIEHSGGSLLWGKDGYIDCIELYANGSFFNEVVEKFELHTLTSINEKINSHKTTIDSSMKSQKNGSSLTIALLGILIFIIMVFILSTSK